MSGRRKLVTVYVPTVNDRLKDFDALFSLWQQTNADNLLVRFDFSNCLFLRQNAVAFLGGLARLIEMRGGKSRFLFETVEESVLKNLVKNSFAYQFGFELESFGGNSVPYREDNSPDRDGLISYLKELWLGKNWVHVSEPLMNQIAGRVWEIYENAFQHGKSPVGVFSCGQHYPRWRELHLTIVDFGVGIPSNVRIHLKNDSISADNAIKWAMIEGNTTKPPQTEPGGVGLGLLKEFVQINNGYLEIFSHDGYAYINKTKETYLVRKSYFEGSLVTIKLKCDAMYYKLSNETDEEPLF